MSITFILFILFLISITCYFIFDWEWLEKLSGLLLLLSVLSFLLAIYQNSTITEKEIEPLTDSQKIIYSKLKDLRCSHGIIMKIIDGEDVEEDIIVEAKTHHNDYTSETTYRYNTCKRKNINKILNKKTTLNEKTEKEEFPMFFTPNLFEIKKQKRKSLLGSVHPLFK
jgi:hypothetical protein